MQPDWRDEFPGTQGRVYLNSAAESLGSRTQAAALQRYAADKSLGAPGREAMIAVEQGCRQRLAARLGCNPAEIAFLSSTSHAIDTVLFGLPWLSGDNLVITDLEFPSAVIAGVEVGQRFGVEVRLVHHTGGVITPEAIAARVDDRTRLVAISHVSFRSGYRFDLEAIAGVAHARGARLLVDSAQSLGAVPVRAGSVDFIAGCTFKWLLGTHGLGFLYCRPDRLEELQPPGVGWRSVQDFFSVLPDLRFQLQDDARRFETGMLAYPALYALHDALGFLDGIGEAAVAEHILSLSGRAVRRLLELGITPLTPADPAHRAGIVAFETPHFQAISEALEARQFYTWCKEGRVRLSAHLYNTAADVDTCLEVLAPLL